VEEALNGDEQAVAPPSSTILSPGLTLLQVIASNSLQAIVHDVPVVLFPLRETYQVGDVEVDVGVMVGVKPGVSVRVPIGVGVRVAVGIGVGVCGVVPMVKWFWIWAALRTFPYTAGSSMVPGEKTAAAEVASGWPGLAESRPARCQVSQVGVGMEPKATHLGLALLIGP
jgi:hypothetical protein